MKYWLFLAMVVLVREGAAAAPDFNRDIKPLLAEHCLQCHGPDKAEAGLDLSRRESATKRLESGSHAVTPGKPDASELLRRIASPNADERMPPGPDRKPLAETQQALLKQWIADGAEWREHWAFSTVSKPSPPAVTQADLVRSPIDRFVLARLEANRLSLAPEADRVTLAKRLSYDLLGLLPPAELVESFVRDESPNAYEKLVDHLLKSPHFGERWGRHWLDLARYADSDGYEKDKARPDAYVFRDWVIRALNDDMPFDQFTIEQIAGDELPAASPSQRIATAFQRQTLTNEEGGVDQEEYRVAAVFDRIETVGAVWLGLTVGCARCHSHKYDPLSHEEYYRLFAFFNSADEVSVSLPVAANDLSAYLREVGPIEDALQRRRREIAPRQLEWETQQRERLRETPNEPLTPLAGVPRRAVVSGAAPAYSLDVRADGSMTTKKTPDSPQAGKPDAAANAVQFVVDLPAPSLPVTGLRLDAMADDTLPGKGPGLSPNGNFVLNQLQVAIVDESGKVLRDVPLQMPSADYEQKGFAASNVLGATVEPKKGWAVGGKVGATHRLTLRTQETIVVPAGQTLRVTLTHAYGRDHVLGRFQLHTLHGDARKLLFPDNVASALEMYPEKRIASVKETLFDYYASQDDEIQSLQRQLAELKATHRVEFRQVRTLSDSLRPRKTHRFHRGEFLQPQEEVSPGVPAVLPPLAKEEDESTKNAARRGQRLELARWLVSDSQPLTPRVAVNHVWLHLFGEGLVRTPGDFGARGEPPTHPELLDWLAATFRDDLKSSVKSLIKTIVMSSTYRQSSKFQGDAELDDPQNRLLRRQNRFRVEGEIVRDLTLDAAGLLSAKVGGPSVFPSMPADLAKLSYANSFSWNESQGEDRYRRGLYTFFKRTIPHPTLMTFDCPDANVACVRRSTSNTPLQALALLNNESFLESAKALATRVQSESADDDARIEFAFRRCLVRVPHRDERLQLKTLLQAAREHYATAPEDTRRLLALKANPDTKDTELAAWTATMRVLLNLDEFVTRE